jgi:hypothetical protein
MYDFVEWGSLHGVKMNKAVRSGDSFIRRDEITDQDIICGTGQMAFNHAGTQR